MGLNRWEPDKWRLRSSRDCGKAVCEPEWRWQPQMPVPDYAIWYVMGGQGEITVNDVRYPVKRGTCMLLHEGDKVSAWHDRNNRLTVIYIHFTVEPTVPDAPSVSLQLPRHVHLDDLQWLEASLQRVLEVERWESAWREEQLELMLKLTVIQLLQEKERRSESPASSMHRQRILKVTDYIRLHIRERLTPEAIGSLFECSPRYLSRMFKQYTGVPLKEYITRVRMERACYLLSETAMTITQIADAVGCSDVYSFSKLFKNVYGASPSHFRFKGASAERHPFPEKEE